MAPQKYLFLNKAGAIKIQIKFRNMPWVWLQAEESVDFHLLIASLVKSSFRVTIMPILCSKHDQQLYEKMGYT